MYSVDEVQTKLWYMQLITILCLKSHVTCANFCFVYWKVYFVDRNGGVKPDSIIVDHAQVKRQEPPINRSQSLKTAANSPGPNISRSDTFDDGRLNKPRNSIQLLKHFQKQYKTDRWVKLQSQNNYIFVICRHIQ